MNIVLATPGETDALGRALAAALGAQDGGALITLNGELGAGKTALVRAVFGGLGHAGAVVSPSYTLIEPYEVAGRRLYHLDLYRLADPEELEFLGVREICLDVDFVFVEWAERGEGFLPAPDLTIQLDYRQTGRSADLVGHSATGRALIANLRAARSGA